MNNPVGVHTDSRPDRADRWAVSLRRWDGKSTSRHSTAARSRTWLRRGGSAAPNELFDPPRAVLQLHPPDDSSASAQVLPLSDEGSEAVASANIAAAGTAVTDGEFFDDVARLSPAHILAVTCWAVRASDNRGLSFDGQAVTLRHASQR